MRQADSLPTRGRRVLPLLRARSVLIWQEQMHGSQQRKAPGGSLGTGHLSSQQQMGVMWDLAAGAVDLHLRSLVVVTSEIQWEIREK